MNRYLQAVTLGAFTWKDEKRIESLMESIRGMNGAWMLLHFLLITLCLNFPMTLIIARLTPFEFFSRLYGDNLAAAMPETAGLFFANGAVIEQQAIDGFNSLMYENNFGNNFVTPMLGMIFAVTLIIQIIFYLCAVFFLKLSRMNSSPMTMREGFGLTVFSSTLPVIAAGLFAAFMPTVHVIVFYFIIIFYIFQRSRLCRNG